MNHLFIDRSGNSGLLLIFAGWAMDHRPFSAIKCSGYDIAVIWDYRNDDISLDLFSGYSEVTILAWSMGVWAASRIIPQSGLPVTLTIAVNGSYAPVDDRKGIPTDIFNATLEALTPASLTRFYRRMAGSSQGYERFKEQLPQRQADELADELRRIADTGPALGLMRWDKAVISTRDAIFPAANLREAWTGHSEIIEIDAPHLPDFQWIIDRWIIDKSLVTERFSRSIHSYDSEASVQNRVADHLWALWQKHIDNRNIGSLIEIGYGTGYFTSLYASGINASTWRLWDLIPATIKLPAGCRPEQCDAETAILNVEPASVDVIVSSSAVQWFNSIGAFLSNCSKALKPGGLVVISTFGELTFRELAQAGAAPLPYVTETSLRALIPDTFDILELHQGIITRAFDTPADVMRHIQATGVNALRRSRPTAELRRLLADYPLSHGQAMLTYNPVYLILRRK